MLFNLLPELFIMILSFLPDHALFNILTLTKDVNTFLVNCEEFWEQKSQREFCLSTCITFPNFVENAMNKYVKIKEAMDHFIKVSRFNRNPSTAPSVTQVKELTQILSQQKDLSNLINHNTTFTYFWYNFVRQIIYERRLEIYGSEMLVVMPLPLDNHLFDPILREIFRFLDEHNDDCNIELFINNLICDNISSLIDLIMRLLKRYTEVNDKMCSTILYRCCLYRISQLPNNQVGTENVVEQMICATTPYELLYPPDLLMMLSVHKKQFIIDGILKEYYTRLIDHGILILELILSWLTSTVNINILCSLMSLSLHESPRIFELKKSVISYVEKFPDAMTPENLNKILTL